MLNKIGVNARSFGASRLEMLTARRESGERLVLLGLTVLKFLAAGKRSFFLG